MCFRKVPISVQCEAAFAAASVNHYPLVSNILKPYFYPFWFVTHIKHVKKYISFTPAELLNYAQQHPELCKWMLHDMGDVRSTPHPLIQIENEKFVVSLYNPNSPVRKLAIRRFDTLEEAITDYVLLSLHMQRLN